MLPRRHVCKLMPGWGEDAARVLQNLQKERLCAKKGVNKNALGTLRSERRTPFTPLLVRW